MGLYGPLRPRKVPLRFLGAGLLPHTSLLPGTPIACLGPHSFSLAPPSFLVGAPLRPSPGRRSRTLGIPAAGQHADGFAGPGELFEELSEGAPGGRGDTVLVHSEQAGDCSRLGARQPVSPARASAALNRSPRPLRARQLAARGGAPRAGERHLVGRAADSAHRRCRSIAYGKSGRGRITRGEHRRGKETP